MKVVVNVLINLIFLILVPLTVKAQQSVLFSDSNINKLDSNGQLLLQSIISDPVVVNYRIVNVHDITLVENVIVNLSDTIFFNSNVSISNNKISLNSNTFSKKGHLFSYNNEYRGVFYYENLLIELRPLDNRNHVLLFLDQSKSNIEDCKIIISTDTLTGNNSTGDLKSNKIATISEECKIRVLVVYTPSARDVRGGDASINSDIKWAEELSNESYENSNVNQRIEIVRSFLTYYIESGSLNTDIDRLIHTNDGYMDYIHDLREIYSADCVVLITNYNGSCGGAYLLANANNAFAIISAVGSCLTTNYSFAHELGHISGCQHDPGQGSNPHYSYGHGFCNGTDDWRTIMSYNTGGNCLSRHQYWSNPDITYNGVPMGSTNTHDNARVLDEREDDVKEFRIIPNNYTIPNETVEQFNIADLLARSKLESSSNFIAEQNSEVTFRAGDEIRITNGFHAKNGSEFHAFIKTSCSSSPKVAYENYEFNIATELTISPNPVTSISDISLTVGAADNVSLMLYDNLGNQRFSYLDNVSLKSGTYNYKLDGNELNSGMFVLVLKIDGRIITEKIINLK